MHLVIVESPTKAKTIRKFLGADYQVLASMGHIRDLPATAADVPEQYKKTPKGRLGVDPANDFDPLYVISKNKSKTVSELKAAMKEASDVYLATDEDREGESISWHLLEVLKPKVPVHRMVFHEITKSAIEDALKHPRTIDERLVQAQETRRILDRLVGYTLSPILWKKIAFGLSAGRVQSSVLKAVVDRERERMRFVKSSYWDVLATLDKDQLAFEAKLTASHGKRIATGKDFAEETGKLKDEASKLLLLDEDNAKKIADESKQATWNVTEVTEKPVTRRPPAPFITSSLQQEANRKLGLSSKETMKLAQGLYEQGYITYMRTDSTALSPEATTAIRSFIGQRFGQEYLPAAVRVYASTSKGAQEAHEAIRPSLNFTPPNETDLTSAQKDLYELIWMRALASQMEDSKQLQVAATLQAGEHTYTANGMKILFPGYLRAYVEGNEDAEQALSEKERILPDLTTSDHPTCQKTEALGHETKPPARFTEAGLVQFMEKEGIGRPSTYAATISTLIDRKYVRKGNGALVPTFTGFAVTQYMESRFGYLVDIGFTSEMEGNLDAIANGKEEWLPYLKNFYFGENGLERKAEEESKKKEETDSARTINMPSVPDIKIHIGRFGPYIEGVNPKSQTAAKASLPEDLSPADLTQEKADELLSAPQQGPTSLGQDPASGKFIFLKTGAYGPYLQLGEDDDDAKIKPKRVSIPKTVPLETLDYAKALVILSLPRLVGMHPDTGKEIRAGLGRFGPYIVHDGDFRSLKGEDDLFTVSLARALELLAEPKGTRRGAAAVLKTLGNHPKDNKPITLHQGKFGPYVKHGATNATVPKTESVDTLTLEQAIALLDERKAKGKTKRTKKET